MSASSIDRRGFCGTVLGGAAAMALSQLGHAQTGRRRNVLFITTDDLGPQLNCYGDPIPKTPNLDALAAEGVRFTDAYVTQASCSPSRSSMFTGLYPHQNGQLGLSHRGYSMKPGLPTLPGLMKQAGYTTGVFGKIHVAPEKDLPFDWKGTPHGKTRDVRLAADSAAEFFTRAGDEPFFLMANYFDPHRPLVEQVKGIPEKPYGPDDIEPLPFFAGVDSPQVRKEVAGYYDCVDRIDVGIGMLMDELKKSGHYDDTLVIFIGDHGPPMTRGKTTCYEAGIRIPFIVWGPGEVRQGVVSEAFVSTVDIMPTVLATASQRPPDGIAGRSLWPILQGKPIKWREYLCAEYNSHHEGGYFPRRSIRDRTHKLILNLAPERRQPITAVDGCGAFKASRDAKYDGTLTREVMERHASPPAIELYDIEADPHEFHDLAGRAEVAHIEHRLLAQLGEWRRATDDPLRHPAELAKLNDYHDELKKPK